MAQTQRISKNNTAILRDADKTIVILHSTPVVTVDHKKNTVTYNTGGWLTATTIARMNQVNNEMHLPYRVSRAGGLLSGRHIHTSHEFSTNNDSIILPL